MQKESKLIEENKPLEQLPKNAEETTEILSEEHDYLKESNERATKEKVEEMLYKVTSCDMKLEKIFRQILPDYKVSL